MTQPIGPKLVVVSRHPSLPPITAKTMDENYIYPRIFTIKSIY
jgi:hypothetical protein